MGKKAITTRWYAARDAAVFLDVTEETVKHYCREKQIAGKQVGPRRKWFVLGSEIERLRRKWSLDIVERSEE